MDIFGLDILFYNKQLMDFRFLFLLHLFLHNVHCLFRIWLLDLQFFLYCNCIYNNVGHWFICLDKNCNAFSFVAFTWIVKHLLVIYCIQGSGISRILFLAGGFGCLGGMEYAKEEGGLPPEILLNYWYLEAFLITL